MSSHTTMEQVRLSSRFHRTQKPSLHSDTLQVLRLGLLGTTTAAAATATGAGKGQRAVGTSAAATLAGDEAEEVVTEALGRQEVQVEVDGVRGVAQHVGDLLEQEFDGPTLAAMCPHIPVHFRHKVHADGQRQDDEDDGRRQQHQVHLQH